MSCLQGMLYWEMMTLLVLLLVFSGVTCSEGGEGTGTCEMYDDMKPLVVTEGEALRVVPDGLKDSTWNDSVPFTWHRQTQLGRTDFSEDEARVHHHGPALFFLPLSINDSGLYIAQLNDSGKCHNFHVPVDVHKNNPLYTHFKVSDSNPNIPCPDQVADLCKDLKGELSWYRNSSLMAGETRSTLRLLGADKANSDVYTCRCMWRHNKMEYNSTASRKLQMTGKSRLDIQITEPTVTELIVHPGFPWTIKCVAYYGMNININTCNTWWEKNNHRASQMDGYSENVSRYMVEPSKHSFVSSTLIINKVQESDLHSTFKCRASNGLETRSHILSLKPAESLTNLVVALVCVSILFLLAATTIKYFAVDLVLFSRRFLRFTKARNDGSQYDVYVVYNSEKESKAIEKVLDKFLSQALPLVLEQKCGYRVFIHGRDDIPGEDRLEQVEERVRLSRRLMVVLTPGSEVNETLGSSPSSPVGVDVNWQVGLYQALVQEIRVILVQLGEVGPQGYTHLSATLQHLIRKCAPLCWREDSPGAAHWNSRFWKRVRYTMPPASAKPSSCSVV